MVIAVEHAGAERGLLILPRGDPLWVEAEARTGEKTVEVNVRQEAVAPAEIPESLLHKVIRTRQSVILDDASAEKPFSADDYIREKRARSVLCLPLVKQAKLIGVLYLENNLASHVFTPARISVLKLLASQAAISLENARLYAELTTSEERWRNLFESVPVGVNMVGLDRRYVAANPAFQRMTGYSEAELRRALARRHHPRGRSGGDRGDHRCADSRQTLRSAPREALPAQGWRRSLGGGRGLSGAGCGEPTTSCGRRGRHHRTQARRGSA